MQVPPSEETEQAVFLAEFIIINSIFIKSLLLFNLCNIVCKSDGLYSITVGAGSLYPHLKQDKAAVCC